MRFFASGFGRKGFTQPPFSKKKLAGFTLLEIMFVVAIIGILASVVTFNVQEARKKARDAQRESDMGQIQLALRLYKDANGVYPPNVSNGSISALDVLVPTYLPSLPYDPLGDTSKPDWDWVDQETYYYWGPGNVGSCGPYKYTLWYRAEKSSEGTAESCVRLDNNSYTIHP